MAQNLLIIRKEIDGGVSKKLFKAGKEEKKMSERVSGSTGFYEILGISKNFSSEELEMAYDMIYCNNHPYAEEENRNSSVGILEAYRAYEILRDPQKRQLYDEYGEDAVKDLVVGRPRYVFFYPPEGFKDRGRDKIYSLKVSLQELYCGTSKKFPISRYVVCSKCNGNGSKSGASMKCSACQGTRKTTSVRPCPYAPEIDQHILEDCYECKGTGELSMDRCLLCKGKKVVTENKVMEVDVDKGLQIGDKIIYLGEADEAPDTITGDIVFVLELTSNTDDH